MPTEPGEFLEYLRSGRDEMNLLEHSISGADKKPDLTTRSLSFASEDRHPETGERVERSWKVTFSAEYGRPTPKDDDVFVALLKVSQQAGLMEAAGETNIQPPQVRFSSYQLIRILGWPENGQSYKAIDDALNRVGGVWIVAKNFWWDNVEKEYVDRKFGIIDDVFLYERDKYDRALKKARLEGRDRPLSWIRWSDVMLDSFKAGYVRKLDIEVYRSLQHPIARKLYRYLGKQFWNLKRTKHRIDLQALCHEKLGYNRAEKRNPRLREKIEPAIQELEARGIYGLAHDYEAGYGKCQIVFTAAKGDSRRITASVPELVTRLVSLGLDKNDAHIAVKRHSEERILADIEHVEHEAKAGRVKTSKAGLLATMLKGHEAWPRPKDFISSANREERRKIAAEKAARAEKLKADQAVREREESERELAAFNSYMASLADVEHEQLRDQALRNGFWGKRYRDAVKDGDSKRIAASLHEALFSAWRAQLKNAFGQGEAQKLSEKSIG